MHLLRKKLWVLGLAALATLAGCSEETNEILVPAPSSETPHFIASPDTLRVTDTAPEATAYLAADAPGTLSWRITAKPSWVTLAPDSGSVTNSPSPVSVHAHAAGMAPGTHIGVVTLLSSGGEDRLTIVFGIGLHPRASVSVTSLQFPAGVDQQPFILRNTGTGYLGWSASASQPWLSVLPSSGYVGAGDSVTVTARVNRQGLPPGTASANIEITSNSEDGLVSIQAQMDVPAAPILSVVPDTLRFGYFENSATMYVRNRGNAPLSWNATGTPSYLQLSTSSGFLGAGDSAAVVISLDRTGLASGVLLGGFTIGTDALQSATVGVQVRNFVETKWLLSHNVVDAEFCRVTNRVITVGDGPSALYILDPEGRTAQSVSLAITPRCVAVSADGQHAVVGHNGYASYVDLAALTVERVYPVTTDAVDIVLPANGWFYVFPAADQWENVRCIAIATGVETLGTGSIYAGSLARLHPSGDYIYDANNGLSPSDVEKHDIRSGTAVRLYDSPYHGDYAFSGNLWITDDGLRLIARSANVFRCSTTPGQDLIYNGNLSGAGPVAWAEQSGSAGRIFALQDDSYLGEVPPVIRVYDSQYLGFLGTVPVPPFLVPAGGGTFQPGKGRFLFSNAAGTRLYVLERAKAGSGLLLEWALAPFDISSMP